MSGWVREDSCHVDGLLLRFMAHLVLFFRSTGAHMKVILNLTTPSPPFLFHCFRLVSFFGEEDFYSIFIVAVVKNFNLNQIEFFRRPH